MKGRWRRGLTGRFPDGSATDDSELDDAPPAEGGSAKEATTLAASRDDDADATTNTNNTTTNTTTTTTTATSTATTTTTTTPTHEEKEILGSTKGKEAEPVATVTVTEKESTA